MKQYEKSKQAEVAIVVPPVVCHHLDPHTGIPFMPHMAAYLAGALYNTGYEVQIIDCFGLQPHQRQLIDEFMLMGIDELWVAKNLKKSVKVVYIYCRTMAEFIAIERLTITLKKHRPDIKICLFENIQAVTSYSLRHVVEDLMSIGCAAAIMGEPELRSAAVTQALLNNQSLETIPGTAFWNNGKVQCTEPAQLEKQLDLLQLPLWEKFPLEGYWIADFSHAPREKRKFLPLLTSRGCSFNCTFCLAPMVNNRWRSRSALNVVNEMEYFYNAMGVREFHISDLNPTVNDERIQQICKLLIRKNLKVTWKLAQGTKIETIKSYRTLELMAKAGCRYISFSPESGSKKLLKIMRKPFDHEHAVMMAQKMHELGIKTQACFIAGVPGEQEDDRKQSIAYAKKLLSVGVDEISVFIFTPVPGAELSKSLDGFHHYSQCTPSPSWRKDYKTVLNYRIRMYCMYFIFLIFRPFRLKEIIKNIYNKRYQTKMEMSLFKQIKLYLLRYFPQIYPRINAEQYMENMERVSLKHYDSVLKSLSKE